MDLDAMTWETIVPPTSLLEPVEWLLIWIGYSCRWFELFVSDRFPVVGTQLFHAKLGFRRSLGVLC